VETSWDAAKVDSIAATSSNDSNLRVGAQKEAAAAQSAEAKASKETCEWEQWFTPEMEMYFYNATTEEFFFPADEADISEKGWARYLDSDGDNQGKVYWWHDASGRSFYEEDAVGSEA
jgi:hypothetical protein